MFSVLMALLFLAYVNECQTQCERGWTPFDDKCYLFNSTEASFYENYDWCQSINATMVSIHSSPQNEFLRHFITGCIWTGGQEMYFNRLGSKWLDRSRWDFSNSHYPLTKNHETHEIRGWTLCSTGTWFLYSMTSLFNQSCQKLVKDVRKESEERKLTLGEEMRITFRALNNLLLRFNEMNHLVNSSYQMRTSTTANKPIKQMDEKRSKANETRFGPKVVDNQKLETINGTLNQCPVGWREYQNHCYLTNGTRITFEQNFKWCHSLGARMFSIHSPQDNIFVKSFISGSTWIGGQQTEDGHNRFIWLDSKATHYSNFSSPSQCIPGCGLILGQSGEWTFNFLDTLNYPICQITLHRTSGITLETEISGLKQRLDLIEKIIKSWGERGQKQ